MYINEYYETLSKNFVQSDDGCQLYMLYHEKSKMDVSAFTLDRKLLEEALSGTEIDAVNIDSS